MGFGLGNLGKKLKNLGHNIFEGGANLLTGGALAQKDALKESKKARDQAKADYDKQIKAAEAEAARIANMEEERKRRIALFGLQNPPTMMTGGYLGITGGANVGRGTLG
jgi:hypothetical protein